MLSYTKRCIYRNNQLAEVICQFRFPEILAIREKLPVDFQEAIREEYPVYTSRKENPTPKLTGLPGNLNIAKQEPVINHQFVSADGLWRVNLTSKFISLTCSKYTRWEDFAARMDKPLVAFIQIYHPAFFERVGLRYLNFFSRKALSLEGTPFSRMIAPCYLGPLAEEDVSEAGTTRCSVDAELALRGGCRVKIHAGPGFVRRGPQQDPEVKFVFDQDLFMAGQVPTKACVGALQTLHDQADALFRGAITEVLHDAMDPRST